MTDRLLTEEEISASIKWLYKLDEYEAGDLFSMAMREITKAQDAKTASLYQKKIDSLIEEIERVMGEDIKAYYKKWWESLKEKYLKQREGISK